MKRRLTLAGLLAVLLAVCLLPLPVLAQSTVDGDIGSVAGFYTPNEVKSFYANGRYWVFYNDFTAVWRLDYRSSVDGVTWSSPTTVRNNVLAYPSVWFDGTYGHYALKDTAGVDNEVFYRRFTPNSNGTLTYSTAEQTATASGTDFAFTTVFVSVDTNGYPWISYNEWASDHPQVTKSNTNDGTWSTEVGFPFELTASNLYIPVIVPLTSGKMLAVYTKAAVTVRSKRWDGVAWGAERAAATIRGSNANFDVVAQDDDVHLVNNAQGTWDIEYEFYDYSTNSWGDNLTLYDGTDQNQAPVISITDRNDLYVFMEETPDADKLYYIKYDYYSGTWGTVTELVDESIIDGLPAAQHYLNADYNADFDKVGVYYVADPQKLKYKAVSESANVTTLAATAITSSAATLRGEIISLGTGVPSERGFEYRLLGGGTYTTSETGAFALGVYSLPVTGLSSDAIHENRAYVVSGGTTSYGEWVSFITLGDYASPWAPEGNDTMIPLPSEPPGWYQPSDPTTGPLSNMVIGALLNPFFEASGFPVEFLWWVLFAMLCNILCLFGYAHGKHTFIPFTIGALVIGGMCVLQIIDWWLIFVYLTMGFSLLVNEKQVAL